MEFFLGFVVLIIIFLSVNYSFERLGKDAKSKKNINDIKENLSNHVTDTNKKIDKLDIKIDRLDTKIDQLKTDMHKEFSDNFRHINSRLDELFRSPRKNQ